MGITSRTYGTYARRSKVGWNLAVKYIVPAFKRSSENQFNEQTTIQSVSLAPLLYHPDHSPRTYHTASSIGTGPLLSRCSMQARQPVHAEKQNRS